MKLNLDTSVIYHVAEGVYPFDEIIGLVHVNMNEDRAAEAASALREAIRVYGGHPVVFQ